MNMNVNNAMSKKCYAVLTKILTKERLEELDASARCGDIKAKLDIIMHNQAVILYKLKSNERKD